MSEITNFSNVPDDKLDEAMETFLAGADEPLVADGDSDVGSNNEPQEDIKNKADDDDASFDAGEETSDEETADEGLEEATVSGDGGKSDTVDGDNSDDDSIDYEKEYKALLAPIKASGKVREIKDIEEARALMSFGIDYHKNMNKISPFVKFGKTLEKHGLLEDTNKLNLLIDAAKGNKDAILTLAKESGVELDEYSDNDEISYTPSDNIIPDEELRLSNVIDEIRDTETFNRTVDIVSKDWDKESKNKVISNPHILKVLNSQVADGTYDKVSEEIERLRILNNIPIGMSDIDIYGAVAKHLQEQEAKVRKSSEKKQTNQRMNASRRVTQPKQKNGRDADKVATKPFSKVTDAELDELLGLG